MAKKQTSSEPSTSLLDDILAETLAALSNQPAFDAPSIEALKALAQSGGFAKPADIARVIRSVTKA